MTSLTIVRRIRARPAIVFEAMTTAEGIVHWWGPDEGPVLVADVDPRLGGQFRVRFRRLDGSEHESRGEFLVFSPYERFAMSWRWVHGGAGSGDSRVDVVLRAVPEGTELIFTHSLLDSEESTHSHEGGWTGALCKLERYCAGQ